MARRRSGGSSIRFPNILILAFLMERNKDFSSSSCDLFSIHEPSSLSTTKCHVVVLGDFALVRLVSLEDCEQVWISPVFFGLAECPRSGLTEIKHLVFV